MFGTDLNREYVTVATALELSESQIAELARNAVRASFLDKQEQSAILTEIDTVADTERRSPTE